MQYTYIEGGHIHTPHSYSTRRTIFTQISVTKVTEQHFIRQTQKFVI